MACPDLSIPKTMVVFTFIALLSFCSDAKAQEKDQHVENEQARDRTLLINDIRKPRQFDNTFKPIKFAPNQGRNHDAQAVLRLEAVNRAHQISRLQMRLEQIQGDSSLAEEKRHIEREINRFRIELEQIKVKAKAVDAINYQREIRESLERERLRDEQGRANVDEKRQQDRERADRSDRVRQRSARDNDSDERGKRLDEEDEDEMGDEELRHRLEHLTRAVEHLHEAGFDEYATRLERHAHDTERRLESRHRNHDGQIQETLDRMMHQIDRLAHQVERLNGEIKRLKK